MGENQTTTLRVSGMTCAACSSHVDRALKDLEGVRKVEVRLRDGLVYVEHDPAAASLDALLAAVVEAGYDAREATAAPG